MAVGPGTPVEPLPASPPRVSLLSSAQIVPNSETDVRWTQGIRWSPEECLPETDSLWWACVEEGGDAPDFEKETGAGQLIEEYQPFVAWAGDACSPFGWNERDYQGRARRKLLANESRIIEAELWTGARAATAGYPNRFLADAGRVTQLESGVRTPHASALAELESALAECGGGDHMIHAMPRLVSLWSRNGMVTPSPDGRVLRTALGTVVVPGAGYNGSGPGGSPAEGDRDDSWAYGTGMVRVWRGPVVVLPGDFASAVDRETNLVTFRAERFVAATWDQCCHVGIRVNHCVELCTVAS